MSIFKRSAASESYFVAFVIIFSINVSHREFHGTDKQREWKTL